MSISKIVGLCCCASAFLLVFLLIGCTSYTPANFTSADLLQRNEAVVKSEGREIHVVVLKDRRLARNYVGIDPVRSSMVPVFMKIINAGNDIVKVDIPGTSLLTDAGESFHSLTIDQAIEKAMRSDAEVVGWTMAFGITGALASGSKAASANKSLEEDYHNKSFKPTLLNTKSSGEGLVFFHVPAEKQALINAIAIQLFNLQSNEPKKITIRF
jgi:hypothetical protein